MKYPGIGRLGGYAEEVAAALRRRRDLRRPRVRVRVGHGEPRVLEDDAPEAQRLLGIARDLVADQGGPAPAG
jgi:glyoxylase-like metal-dependent hydrolase (beta-lactamase superfamily II)